MPAELWLAHAAVFLDRAGEGNAALDEVVHRAESLQGTEPCWAVDLLILYRRIDDAWKIVAAAPAAVRSSGAMRKFEAQLHYEARQYEAALEILSPELIGAIAAHGELAHHALFIRGRCLDATGRYEEAHRCFTRMNETAEALYTRTPGEDLVAAYAGLDLGRLPRFELDAPAAPTLAFMVGFPRSGTTLLDTILATQPRIRTLSEVSGVTAAIHAVAGLGKRYPADLHTLTAEEVGALRERLPRPCRPFHRHGR